jgi:hypothetical protein
VIPEDSSLVGWLIFTDMSKVCNAFISAVKQSKNTLHSLLTLKKKAMRFLEHFLKYTPVDTA